MKGVNNCFNAAEWTEIYKNICLQLGIDRQTDINHVKRVHSLLPENYSGNNPLNMLLNRVKQKNSECIVFGAAPVLEIQFQSLIENQYSFNKVLTIAADGVTRLFRKNNLFPDVIVTDLDGIMEYRDEISSWPSYLVIHVHGDNEQLLSKFWDFIPFERTIFTTQTAELGQIFNFGGFTDGDRAISFALALGFTSILLVGFDLKVPPGKFSKANKWTKKKLDLKMKKLKIAEEILEILKTKKPNIIKDFNFNQLIKDDNYEFLK